MSEIDRLIAAVSVSVPLGSLIWLLRKRPMFGYIDACFWMASRMAAYAVAVEAGYRTYLSEVAATSLRPGERQ